MAPAVVSRETEEPCEIMAQSYTLWSDNTLLYGIKSQISSCECDVGLTELNVPAAAAESFPLVTNDKTRQSSPA